MIYSLAFSEEMCNLEDNVEVMEGDLRKRGKYLKKCKDNMWNRWKNEYVKSLQHNMKRRREFIHLYQSETIKGDERK